MTIVLNKNTPSNINPNALSSDSGIGSENLVYSTGQQSPRPSSFEHEPNFLHESTEDLKDLTEILSGKNLEASDSSSDTILSSAQSIAHLAISILQLDRGKHLINSSANKMDALDHTKSSSKVVKASGEFLSVASDAAIKILSNLPSDKAFDLSIKCLGISSVTGLSGSAAALLGISAINIYEVQQAYKQVGKLFSSDNLEELISSLQNAYRFTHEDKHNTIAKLCTTPSFSEKISSFLKQRAFKEVYKDALSILRHPTKETIDAYLNQHPEISNYEINAEHNLDAFPASWESFFNSCDDQQKQNYQDKLSKILFKEFNEVQNKITEGKKAKFDRTFGKDVRIDLEKLNPDTTFEVKTIIAKKAQSSLRKHLVISVFKMFTAVLFSASIVFLQISTSGLLSLFENILNIAIPVIFLLTELYRNWDPIYKKLKSIYTALKNIVPNIKNFISQGKKIEKIVGFIKDSLKSLIAVFTLMLSVVTYLVTKNCTSLAATIGLGAGIVLCIGFLIYSYIESHPTFSHA